jgi:hypothetical protein
VQVLAANVLGRDGNNNITVQLTLTNNGTGTATNVVLSGVNIGGASGSPLPQTVGTLLPSASTQVVVTVPGSAGATGAASSLTISGTYLGGSFTSTARITLP